MTTNSEWLDYLAHNAPDELAAWFDAEHVETEERALDGDAESESSNTDAVSERYATAFKWLDRLDYGKGGVIDNSFCDTPEQGEVAMPIESWREYLDTASENEDSREQLEADIEEWASIMDLEDQIDMIHGWLNRRAAILEREMVKFNRRYFDCVEQEKKIAELQAQVDELKAERVKLKSQICKLEDDLVRTSDERDNWKANCEDWKKHARAAENACYETMLEREDYRKKFGKCIDYADAIHALMDDEGMA